MSNLKEDVLKAITEADEPMSVGGLQELLSRTHARLVRRTLQRALNDLVEEGEVSRQGGGRSTVYARALVPDEVFDIQLSEGSRDLLSYLALPAIRRRPVGYRTELLFDYDPNVTFLLPETTRTQLHDMGRTGPGDRPAGTHLRDVLGRLLIDLAWASSRLEGNTYSLLDTKRLIEEGRVAEGKDRIETVMILNHKAAIEMIAESPEQVGMNRMTFLNLHALLADGLMGDPDSEGRLRRRPVDITGSVYAPTAIPQRIEECFDRILETAGRIRDPFEASFFLMMQIPYLQPFEDVNKRVSRLGANIPLIKANVSPLSFIDMSETLYLKGMQAFYETGRADIMQDVYLAAYDRSCQRYAAISKDMVEPDPFRLAWRRELFGVVRDLVGAGSDPTEPLINPLIPEGVPEADRDRFRRLVLSEVGGLHEGNFMRYGIRPAEFSAWTSRGGSEEPEGPDEP